MKTQSDKTTTTRGGAFAGTGRLLGALAALALLLGVASTARANNVTVTNEMWVSDNGGSVQFDVAWSNSWRETWNESGTAYTNWDAAWVFIKFRNPATSGVYKHATLSTTKTDHSVPSGATLDVGLTTGRTPGDGVGVFIYRATTGNPGPNNWTGVKLRWRNDLDGVPPASAVDIQVHAIEMVYVPQGAFKVGSGGAETSPFYDATSSTTPFNIASEGAITVQSSGAGNLYYASGGGDRGTPIPAAFPKGYAAFYCMKYRVTQGQYAAFLNALTQVECGGTTSLSDNSVRYYKPASLAYRYSLTGNWPNITAGKPYVACNHLSWADGASYAAWAGLRPMTELEYEKACRGPIAPVANEYAWGSTNITQATNIVNDGAENETATPSGANCVYGTAANVQGPLRAGVFATSTSDRAGSGASYWGIMELSGNLWERAVTIGNAKGRGFQGTHGAGTLTLPADWPQADAAGAGYRGGSWGSAATDARVSERANAASTWAERDGYEGSCGVRTAP